MSVILRKAKLGVEDCHVGSGTHLTPTSSGGERTVNGLASKFITVDGGQTISGALDVEGAVACASTLDVVGTTTVDDLDSTGTADLSTVTATTITVGIGGLVSTSGSTTLGVTAVDELDVAGAVACSDTLSVEGAVVFDDDLEVGQVASLKSAVINTTLAVGTNATIDGKANIGDTFDVAGKSTLVGDVVCGGASGSENAKLTTTTFEATGDADVGGTVQAVNVAASGTCAADIVVAYTSMTQNGSTVLDEDDLGVKVVEVDQATSACQLPTSGSAPPAAAIGLVGQLWITHSDSTCRVKICVQTDSSAFEWKTLGNSAEDFDYSYAPA